MKSLTEQQSGILNDGFVIINDVYSSDEINAIIELVAKADQSNPTFRKTEGLFAIRQFLKEVPEIKPLIFNANLKLLLADLFGDNYFIVKSIYFDKPEKSNWFVSWHQDITIAVDKKVDLPNYSCWTRKFNQYAVQPPINILLNNFTIRVHLDDTDESNGALKIISGSHLRNICRVDNVDWNTEYQSICKVKSGGMMIMRPLLMHASSRTISNKKRRVIHIEFGKDNLPEEICWSEKEIF